MTRSKPRSVELLWFKDCPNHEDVRRLVHQVVAEVAPGTPVADIEVNDPEVSIRLRFPGSPTVRVDGRDVDPRFRDPGDYSPRCRVYWTPSGPRGRPEREWIESALR